MVCTKRPLLSFPIQYSPLFHLMVSCLRVQVDGHWVQGVLYLTDVPEDAGGINCSPRGPEAVKEWLQQLPPDSKPAEADLVALFKPQPVPGKAGDLVIWHSASHRCCSARLRAVLWL